MNVIEAHFLKANPDYCGIVWKAIANGAVRALTNAGYSIVEPAAGGVPRSEDTR